MIDTVTFEPAGRRFVNFPRDTPPARFGPLAGFVEIWGSKRRGDRLPAWSSFDFYDFVGWHGLIYVDQIVSVDPYEARCRLWGTRLVELLGHDETGELFSESPAAGEPGLRESNERIARNGEIGITLGRARSYNRETPFTVVKLPCAEDGVTVDRIVGCSQPDFLLEV